MPRAQYLRLDNFLIGSFLEMKNNTFFKSFFAVAFQLGVRLVKFPNFTLC